MSANLGKTVREWAPLVIAILGAGAVWGTTQASLADVSTRVTRLESSQRDDAEWRRRVESHLTAIRCHLDPGRCLHQ